MGVYEEARSYIVSLLAPWDFSSVFPAGYTGAKNVELVLGNPQALISRMQQANNGQMVRPIVAVLIGNNSEEPRTLGDFYGYGATPPAKRYATREHLILTIGAWADAQVGGEPMTVKLASQIVGCMFVNKTGPAALVKPLTPHAASEAYEERPQLWRCDTQVDGFALISYDK
jgi:hypothetical protein